MSFIADRTEEPTAIRTVDDGREPLINDDRS